MELYASDFPAEALNSGVSSEFQEMAIAVGLGPVRYGHSGKNHLNSEKDESNPYFTFDPAKCIVCSRCVRACDEVQGTFALTSKVAASRRRYRRATSPSSSRSASLVAPACRPAPRTASSKRLSSRKDSRIAASSRRVRTAAWAA